MVLKSMRSPKVLRCAWPAARVLLSTDGTSISDDLEAHGAASNNLIEAALDADILVSKSRLEDLERFFKTWTWGPAAGAFMFGYRTDAFVSAEEELKITRQRKPTQVLLPEGTPSVRLPAVKTGKLMEVAGRRRSRRRFADQPVQLESIASCLQAAVGITGELKLENGQTLPLTSAPSPGGLNTYDGYLLVRNVAGVETGTYCYLPQNHALARIDGSAVPFDQLFGGQAWCAKAACAIVLVADLNRQASRYVFPTTLSAALIEAGARIELLLLQAEEESLSATAVGMNGVGAFDIELAEKAGLPSDTSMTAPICAVLVGTSA
jgi:SagB-type dehydrogenase family enzyme